jgi:hypothetical protein
MIVRYLWGCFKSLAVLGVVLQLTACSLDSDVGASVTGAGTGARTGTGTGTASLSWIAPSEREDETGLSMAEIGGYRIYYGTKEGSYPNQVNIADGSEVQGTIVALPGTYYVVVTAYDVDGRESAFSSPALKIQI